ncbi:PQQ-binding-like beta-propeller repeat protein [Haladaptatus sp.]|uniref:outer membrane protein assembly factor BamB family protein n=1 Tax=Haladaptatus sp. TaxID=1973141 RepID=UPI003C33A792
MSSDEPYFSRRQLIGAGGLAALGAWYVRPSRFTSDQSLDRPIPQDTWPTFGRDASRSGYALTSDAPTEGVRVAWKAEVGEPYLALPALVGEDTVYTTTQNELVALDAEEGTERWRFGEEFIQGGPAVVGDTAYYSAGVSLFAVSGDYAKWKFETNSSFEEILSVGNTIFISSYYEDGTKLIALDAESGVPRWMSKPGLRPLAYADEILVGTGEYGLVAVNATNGERGWHLSKPGLPGDTARFGFGPTIAGGMLFGGSERLYAVDIHSGKVAWTAGSEGGMAVSDGETVYRSSIDGITAFDAADGTQQWQTSTGLNLTGSLALSDEILYAGIEGGLAGVNPETGKRRVRFESKPNSRSVGQPAITGNRVYVGVGTKMVALEEP